MEHRAGTHLACGSGMEQMLALSSHLPRQVFEPGEVVVREGEAGAGLWVLESGALRVRKAGIEVNSITRPGAIVGEISALLRSSYSATVEATARSVLRHAADAQALMDSHPTITRLMAEGLAERLNYVTSYLADLKAQYGDAPGLTMVSAVLRELAERQGERARPGSARDPQPDY